MSISKNARFYDEYSNIQFEAARSLIKETGGRGLTRVLEIGCGTGNYTRLLAEKFGQASIIAVDKSKRMVETAKKKLQGRNLRFIAADAEALELDGEFDLITSNAAFQWFKNLEQAMLKYKNALTENGAISFSVFGPETFCELGHSLRLALGSDVKIDAADFLKKYEIDAIMKRHFKDVVVREEIVKETFGSLAELLNKIRRASAWGDAVKNILLWKRDAFKKTEEIYRSSFGEIEASYQIFFCKGTR